MTKLGYLARVTAAAGALVVTTATGIASSAASDDGAAVYAVTITNITRGQNLTPVLVATHLPGVRLFTLGQPAAPALVQVAEEGDIGPLMARAQNSGVVFDLGTTTGLLEPGQTQTVRVRARGPFTRLSAVAMLIPTNDGFFAVDSAELPRAHETTSVDAMAYDAGSERNDELCASIPGPFFTECGGAGGGGAPNGGEEGYVHVHAGVHGIGDLNAAERDWRNPVARVTIRRVR
ncbi:MAG: spondin domain-containing protein [Acidobacteriota bacterium]|nr:spondin domain-containing protein [Acidobacteriota bacterium]